MSAFTIGIPAFFLALEPNKNIIKGKFLSNVLSASFPAGLTAFIVIAALVVFGQVFHMSENDLFTRFGVADVYSGDAVFVSGFSRPDERLPLDDLARDAGLG